MRTMPTVESSLKERSASLLSPLVLASASPNRLELLRDCGVAVTARPQDVDESFTGLTRPDGIVSHIAALKMDSYLKSREYEPDSLALSLDTMVCLDGLMLGKPHSREDAESMLCSFSGRAQEVVTGFCLHIPGRGVVAGADTSIVWFEELSADEIESYLATGEWKGAAGAYRIQKTGWRLIERIEGSWTNVIGLPLEAILEILEEPQL